VPLHHEHDGQTDVLATDIDVASSLFAKARGLMGCSRLPADYAMYFPFERVRTRGVHMVFVRTPLDVVWLVEDTVRRVETLGPWTGHARARADAFVELPEGAASEVTVGDTVRLVA